MLLGHFNTATAGQDLICAHLSGDDGEAILSEDHLAVAPMCCRQMGER